MRLADFTDFVEVGRGGESTVYRARQRGLEREVVLKAVSGTADRCAAMWNHASRLAALGGGIAPAVLAVFPERGHLWLVSEWVRGITLSEPEVMRWSAATRLHLCLGLTRVLGRLHEQGMVHGDLKPSNVIAECGGGIRLLDISAASGPGRRESVLGTAGYIAPEILRSTAQPSAKSDLFALGVVLRRLLGDVTSGTLGTIIDQCQAENPDERPASAAEVVGRIETLPSGSPEESRLDVGAVVERTFRHWMSVRCAEAARKRMGNDRLCAYRLCVESLDLDPDNGDAMGLLDRMPAKQTRPRWTPARLWVVSAVVCVVVAGAAVGVQIGGSHCGGAVVLPAIADEDRYLDNSAAADLTSAGPADVAGHSRKRTSSPDLLVSPDAPMPATGHLVPCAMADVKRLFVDGREILVRDSGVPLVLVPGEHRVRALLTDGGICEQVITLLPYEVRRLVVSSCNGGTGR